MERVLTNDGSWTARHPIFEQEFHSREGARFEAVELYINRSGFKTAVSQQSVTVLDIGMGLGYNALTTIEQWMSCSDAHNLNLVSLEKDPTLVQNLLRQNGSWQENWPDLWKEVITHFSSDENPHAEVTHPCTSARTYWKILTCDAAADLSWASEQSFDFFWQDPFSLPHNPELWSPEWFRQLKSVAKPKATLMTYSVAREVKTALNAAGWNYERIATPGRKRHWLRAQNQIE